MRAWPALCPIVIARAQESTIGKKDFCPYRPRFLFLPLAFFICMAALLLSLPVERATTFYVFDWHCF
jgi:hypothetical protein